MRILLASRHRYPAAIGGLAGARVLDCLAKGLSELGHTVFYFLEGGSSVPLAGSLELVTDIPPRLDIVHAQDKELVVGLGIDSTPWVRTCHVDVRLHGREISIARENWIFVSRSLAQTYGCERYVSNGIDPAEYFYSEKKENFLLFVSGLERARMKGFDLAIEVAQKTRIPLVVAGSSWNRKLVSEIATRCSTSGVQYVGEVYGAEKARLFAQARALLFPTQWNESFGLVMPEALMSGTPVICSNFGACPELISPDVGFLCEGISDYIDAVYGLHRISSRSCREKALRDFHYLRMSMDYVRYYEKFIALWAQQGAEVV